LREKGLTLFEKENLAVSLGTGSSWGFVCCARRESWGKNFGDDDLGE